MHTTFKILTKLRVENAMLAGELARFWDKKGKVNILETLKKGYEKIRRKKEALKARDIEIERERSKETLHLILN